MKFIIVRKTLKYDPTCGGKFDQYGGHCRITERVEDPGVLPGQTPMGDNSIKKVFCSPALRAKESVESKMVLEELDEVGFALRKMVTRREFEKYGSVIVRQRFLDGFVKDTLSEKRKEIKFRMDTLINKIRKLPAGRYLLISHSFFMKILEVYLQEKDLFEKPEKLSGYLNPRIRTYNFGEGFEFEI
jgi:broad specificity phosphatase PhoE